MATGAKTQATTTGPSGDVRNVTSVSSNTLLEPTHEHVTVDTSGGVVTITLPSGAQEGRTYTIKRDGANKVTVDTEGTETIDGDTEEDLVNDDDALIVTFISANNDWEVT